MGEVSPDIAVFAAARYGAHRVHVKGSVVKRLVIGHFAAAVEVEIAAVIADKIARFAPAAVFFAQLAEQVDAQQDILLVVAGAAQNVGFGKHGEVGGIDLQRSGNGGAFRIRFVDCPQRQPVQAHEFGYRFAHGKWRGKFGIKQGACRIFAFFGMMRRHDPLFAALDFAFGGAAFFYVVQHGGGKQDMLLLLAECLEFGQLQQGFAHHFGMDKHIAFSVPFRILRHVFHVGKPAEAAFQGLPVGEFAGCVVGECPHGGLSYYWMT